jgi:hypothetical protein
MKRYRFLALLGGSAAICAAWTIAPSSAVCQDPKKTAKPNSEAQHCQTTKKDSARVPCYKQGNSSGPPSPQKPIEPAIWQLASGGRSRLHFNHENRRGNAIGSGHNGTDAALCRGRHHRGSGRSSQTLAAADAPQSNCRGECNDIRIHCKRGDARSFGAASGESIRAC